MKLTKIPYIKPISFAGIFCFLFFSSSAQSIVYAETDKDDIFRNTEAEVIGKMNNNFLVYKKLRNTIHYISLYNENMQQIKKEKLDFMPDKIISSEILAYKDFFYLLYQYQKKKIVYFAAAKIDSSGKKMQEPLILDTTELGYSSNNKIYSLLTSEDKKQIALLKINSKDEKNYLVTIVRLDNNLRLRSKITVGIAMEGKNTFLTEFNIDNNANVAFVKTSGLSKNTDDGNINDITLLVLNDFSTSAQSYKPNIQHLFLDDVRMKIDNLHGNYLISSLYATEKKGNIEGIYTTLWNKNVDSFSHIQKIIFSKEFRKNAKTEGNEKYAFNNYFIQHIIFRQDGGYLISAESVYSSSRGNTFNRWDYYGYPYYPSDYYFYYSPFSYYYYPWYYPWRYGMWGNNVRFYADNIALMSFDSTGNMEWGNIIPKSQFDDNTDNFLGYTIVNTGNAIHFLFNQMEKKNILLTVQSVYADGQIKRSPTLRNLDKGYEFMPRFAKQVSAHEIIIPCQYRNYLSFAKIEM